MQVDLRFSCRAAAYLRDFCEAKIVQGESKNASLLAFFAEPQPIFVIFEAKIVQGESKNASLLAFFAEPQPIFVIFMKQR